MLGAVAVHLERQRLPGVDRDSLDLKAGAGVYHVVPSPWAVGAPVVFALGPAFRLQPLHYRADFLRALAARRQNGVRRLHYDDVLKTDGGD